MICKKTDELIEKWLKENEDKIINDWFQLIEIPSVRGEKEENAPFGLNCAKALAKGNELFDREGFETRLDKENRYAIANWKNSDKVIGLFGHCDVVPVGDDWVYTQPFAPKVIDGIAFGRGTSDDKAGIIASLYAMKFLRDNNIPFKSSIMAFTGSNEESGMEDIQAFSENEKMPDICLIPDAEFPCSVGEAGILHAMYQCETPLSDIMDFKGGEAYNIVLGKVNVVLKDKEGLFEEIEKLKEKNITLSRKDGKIFIEARGLSKHAAYLDGSVNAGVTVAKVLSKCPSLSNSDRKIMNDIVDSFLPYYGEGMGISYEEEGFGKLSAANGIVKVENSRISASIDIRYGGGLPGKELEEKLNSAWENKGWENTYMSNDPGFRFDKESTLPDNFVSIYNEITGENKEPHFMMGGTYSRYLKNAMAIGAHTSIEKMPESLPLEEAHGGVHQPDECVAVKDMVRGIRVLIHYLIAADKDLNK
ncbi:MAG: Sapep family Mn(2+)-dependent dipeptidase [Clostridia bacterium]|nr:Sapep family Mn(2+)-dependent dipeptidase [Clostridia bacterium]